MDDDGSSCDREAWCCCDRDMLAPVVCKDGHAVCSYAGPYVLVSREVCFTRCGDRAWPDTGSPKVDSGGFTPADAAADSAPEAAADADSDADSMVDGEVGD